jgi:16S rRNA (uracil1498-N3)-methyltransferase
LKRFYSTPIENEITILDEIESHHCKNVLRCQNDENVEIIDGIGNLYVGVLNIINKKNITISSLKLIQSEQNKNFLTVAIAPPKNQARLEWFIEKATEIGIKNITILNSERSEKVHYKLDRYKQITIAALKQSQQLWLPEIKLAGFKEFIFSENSILKTIGHCLPENKVLFTDIIKPQTSICVLIGPEGDFTPKEIEMAISQKYVPISLGNTRLRTETAALQACSWVASRNQ